MFQSEQVLGPRWSLQELRTFYILLNLHHEQWDKIEKHLPQRSRAMVHGLFAMHRNYLSLSEASVEGFCAIMTDHYEMQDQQNMTIENDNYPKMTVLGIRPKQVITRKKRRLENCMTTLNKVTTLLMETRTNPIEPLGLPSRHCKRRNQRPIKTRAWLRDNETGRAKVYGSRYNLPWSHWFYSYLDRDFYSRNEFMECLSHMGLGKITMATRPIWSSIRAFMGRPRRLSPLFFLQEMEKLETYRTVKRQVGYMKLSTDKTWPYRCSPPLQSGMPVIVWTEPERCFRIATVTAFRETEDTCQVSFSDNGSSLDMMECSLNNVMVLPFPLWSEKSETSAVEPKLSATTLLRRENGIAGKAPILSAPKPTYSIDDRHHNEKAGAILVVKSLLYRKEKIISAMAHLNKCAADEQRRLHDKDTPHLNLWTTPRTILSTARKDIAWTNSRERRQFQKQHSWLAANLNATNKHLKTALLTLQSFSAVNPSEAESSRTELGYPSDSLEESDMMPREILTESQIRWAIDFLAASQQKAALVVAESVSQLVNDDKDEVESFVASANETHVGNVLPDTMQLVANCVTLVSILHRHVAASPNVPPVVTQKLVERVLELLKPSHEANMDLYAELHAAANTAQAQWRCKVQREKPITDE